MTNEKSLNLTLFYPTKASASGQVALDGRTDGDRVPEPHQQSGNTVKQYKQYLESQGFPVLYVEDVYSISSPGKLRTTFQAFIEMLG
jgi:hypothetical protein